MSREVERKVDGQLRKCTQYYHRVSAVTVVSTPFPVFLGVRFQQDGETEVACSLALLKDLSEKLGRRRKRGRLTAGARSHKQNGDLPYSARRKHPQPALVPACRMIRVLAYTLTMVFYYRQVRGHCRDAPPGFCDMAR
jgi:hypothetical protein